MTIIGGLIFILLLGNNYGRRNATKSSDSVKQKPPYIYGNILYENFCYVSDKILICGNKNDENFTYSTLENQSIEGVVIYSNFTNYLKKDQLLIGREANIQSLKFANNSIKFIESKTFDVFESLEILNFYKTNLTIIDENVLTEKLGSHLKRLFLVENNVIFLPSSAFQFLINLRELSLEGNGHVGKFINNGIFTKSLKKVSWLHLTNCNITVLTENVFVNLTNLEYLLLSHNPLTAIPKAINIIPKLFLLSIGSSNIKSIQDEKEIFNENLKILSLIGSKELTNIGSCALCNFPKLYSIDFTFCSKLSQIHPNAFGSVEDIPQLLDIKLESCNISSLPEEILKRKLKLFLTDNPINAKGVMAVNVLQ